MTDDLKQFVDALIAAWNNHDIDVLCASLAPDFEGVDVARPGIQQGPDGAEAVIEGYLHAFPDLHITPHDMVVNGRRVVVMWTATGTHEGKVLNIPPTNRSVRVSGISILTFEAGAVKRARTVWDVAGLLRDLGLLPQL